MVPANNPPSHAEAPQDSVELVDVEQQGLLDTNESNDDNDETIARVDEPDLGKVKSVDFHSTEPWLLTAHYSGVVVVWEYPKGTILQRFALDTEGMPVRCAKFVERRQWIVAGADDMKLYIADYGTGAIVKTWQPHTDYIRYVEVHPTYPYILSCSDDMTVKVWDWEYFSVARTFTGHAHYVMQVKINPTDPNSFATASLDRTIRFYNLDSDRENEEGIYALEGHERGVNCIAYDPLPDSKLLFSGSDDRTVKMWDYQKRAMLYSFEGHEHNVCAVLPHPSRSLQFASTGEDGVVRIWSSDTKDCKQIVNLKKNGRAWALACHQNTLAVASDEGCTGLDWNENDIPLNKRWFFLTMNGEAPAAATGSDTMPMVAAVFFLVPLFITFFGCAVMAYITIQWIAFTHPFVFSLLVVVCLIICHLRLKRYQPTRFFPTIFS